MTYAENILICIVAPLIITIFFVPGKIRLYTFFFCIGMIVCLLSAYINGFFSLIGIMSPEASAVYISPVLEEIMKFLPMLFYMLLLKPDNYNIFLTSIAVGTGFATFENCCYILSSGAEKFSYALIRGMATGVMHVVSILALALGIMLILWLKVMSFPALLGALSLSMTFHALYNLLLSRPGLSSDIGFVLPLIAAAVLYVPYRSVMKIIIPSYEKHF